MSLFLISFCVNVIVQKKAPYLAVHVKAASMCQFKDSVLLRWT